MPRLLVLLVAQAVWGGGGGGCRNRGSVESVTFYAPKLEADAEKKNRDFCSSGGGGGGGGGGIAPPPPPFSQNWQSCV